MNILTFDIEEWYIYELYPKGGRSYYLPIIDDYLGKILDRLDEVDTKATFFCLGAVARTDPKVIKKIAGRGHEIGCHSNNHLLINQMTPSAFKEDTHQSIDSLEQLTGTKIEFYRAPAFSVTENTQWALEILIEEGITCDSSIIPVKSRFGGFPSFKEMQPSVIEINGQLLKEFPISYATFLNKKLMFSGGGYFRLFPYWVIKKWMTQSDYNIAYFHIRDFDSQQKRVYSKNYFFSYYGIGGAFNKFNSLIKEFDFISMGSAIEQINWQKVPRIKLMGK
ncbi:MAG TPA: polysaccharide deacetylase family protein [Paludibacter sp.]